jgi:pilus assembly protein CpaC
MRNKQTLALLGLATAAAVGPALAQDASGRQDPAPAQLRLEEASSTNAVRSLTLGVNRTYLVEFDADVEDIIVANPAIASVTARDRRRIAVMGLAPGASNVIFLDSSGRKLLVLEISVTDNVAGLDELRSLIKRYVPNNRVQVEGVNGRIILAGAVPNLSASERVMTLAKQYVRGPNDVLNMMTIEGKDQVALKVRIVEMQRSVIKQLGVNLAGAIAFGELDPLALERSTIADLQSTTSFGVNGSALGGLAANIGYTNYAGNAVQSAVGAALNALERVGVLRTLAEPNLTALSGESAKFLAGGEFPVPVAQDRGTISIQFKPFGVGLGFTPVVLSEGRISLQVSTEVSELTNNGAFQSLSAGGVDPNTGQPIVAQTISVPALKVRRAETTVELPSGGSLVIAGLIQEQTRQSIDGIPGAKDIPVLGALFRSRDFINDETELVVIVTPYLVDPTDPRNLRSPDDGFVSARDLRTVLFGKLNEIYAVPGSAVSKTSAPKGASGFIVD